MKLARAFTERARLTRKYSELEFAVSNAQIQIETTDGVNVKTPKVSLDEAYTNLRNIGTALAELNAAIDLANAKTEARKNLSLLTSLKRQQNLVERKIKTIECFHETEQQYDSYAFDPELKDANGCPIRGVKVTKTFELLTKIDWDGELLRIKKQIRNLEDEISEINATTEVELSDELLEVLENL